MKVIIQILFLFIGFSCFSQQGLYIKGATLMNVNADAIYVTGEVLNDTNIISTTDSKILNTGKIYVTQDITNNTGLPIFWNDSSGKVILNGTSVQQLIGDSLNFYALEVNNMNGVILQDSITLQDTLLLSAGNFNLNGNQLSISNAISSSGVIVGENNANYIYGNGNIFTERTIGLGGNIAGMGLMLPNNTLGSTILRRYHNAIPNAGDGSVSRYYTLQPTTIDTVETDFAYLDHEINGLVESDLDVFHSVDSTWWKRQSGTPNFASNTVNVANVPFTTGLNFLTVAEYYCDAPPVIAFSSDTVYRCGNDSVLLQTNLSNSHEFKWSNNVVDSSQYVNVQGVYIVEVWSPEGCYSIDSVMVIDKGNPYAEFTVPVMTCLGEVTEFKAVDSLGMEPIVNYQWLVGDPTNTVINTAVDSLNYLYPIGDSINATLVVMSDFGCVDSVTHKVLVDSLPPASFTFLDVCDGDAVVFNNTSNFNGLSSAISLNNWSFGDGNISAASNVTHTYGLPGTYNVQLIVTENTGCKDTIVQAVTVHPNPTVTFTSNQVCERTATDFTNTSSGATSFQWSFESPNQSTATNPSYVFSNDGAFNVQLIGASTFGCNSSTTEIVTVNLAPQALFSFIDTCAQSIADFVNASTDTIIGSSYSWSFDDGATASIENPSHSYTASGSYDVKMIVTSGNGCKDSISNTFDAFELPVASFTFSDACEDSLINFSNMSSIPTGSITSQVWDFGNGTNSNLVSPSKLYTTTAVYPVSLITISDNGCRDTIINNVTIYENPVVNLGGTVSTCGASVILNAGNVGSNFLWNTMETSQAINVISDGDYNVSVSTAFGCHEEDTVTVFLNIVTHPDLGSDTLVCDAVLLDAYSPAATYTWSTGSSDSIIHVTVAGTYWVDRIDQNGCTGTDTVVVAVNSSPTVDLGADQSVCEGVIVNLDAGNPGLNFSWNNGQVTQSVPTDTSGLFIVQVMDVVTTCSDIDSIEVLVNPLPIISLGNDTTVCDSMLYSETGFASYLWSDGFTGTMNNINSSGLVWLEVTDINNCSFRDTVNVIVEVTPLVNLGNDTTLCNGVILGLQSGIATDYMWSTGATTQSISVSSSGQYDVTASNGGCIAYDTVDVFSDSIWQVDIGEDASFCAASGIVLIPNYSQNLTFEWRNPVNIVGSADSLSVFQSGLIVVQATNGYGCSSTDTITLNAINAPVTAEFLAPTTVLAGDTVNFVCVSLDSSLSYSWSYGDNTFSTDQNGQHSYFLVGSFDVTLLVSNGVCIDSVTKEINIGPKSSFNWSANSIANENSSLIDAVIYPNPNNGEFKLAILCSEELDLDIQLLDLNGRIVSSRNIKASLETVVNFQDFKLSNGVYMVMITAGVERINMLFVKQ